jgi:hypothetical protein
MPGPSHKQARINNYEIESQNPAEEPQAPLKNRRNLPVRRLMLLRAGNLQLRALLLQLVSIAPASAQTRGGALIRAMPKKTSSGSSSFNERASESARENQRNSGGRSSGIRLPCNIPHGERLDDPRS